ncbi:MFS transporter [Streptococcus minor]|uniref:MFS transporter n=1 Tax=Streptococcus minor TaxID=229549 RepID=UPI00039BB583|nr:MFS transporter [Streptococcus minor]
MRENSNKKKTFFLLMGIMMMGAVMRVPFTAIPAVLTDIAMGLGVPVSDLGILTSLPLIMFALCSTLAPKWAARLGLEKLLGVALLVMTVGSLLRIAGVSGLYLGTLLIGVAIATINVLLPSLVSVHFPLKVGTYTTIYITMMGLAGTVGSMVAVPIVAATSWQTFVILLTLLVAIAAVIWLPNWRYNHRFAQPSTHTKQSSLWKNKAALNFLVFGGLQSLLFYTEMTWLPTIAQTAGLSKAEGGLLAGIFNLISIPVSMVIPAIVSRLNNSQRAWFMSGISLLTVIGLILMLLAPANFVFWIIISLILGLSVGALFPYMMLSFTLKTSDGQATARLSGMVQSGGYLLASIGPVLLGYSFPVFGTWKPLIFALLAVTLVMIVSIIAIEKHDTII